MGLNEAAGLRRGRPDRPRHRLHRRPGRSPSGAVLPRPGVRGPGPRRLRPVRARDARATWRSRHSDATRRSRGGPCSCRTTFRDPSLSAASQAGLVNNLNDGMAWGLLPLFFASHGLARRRDRRPRRRLSGGLGPRPDRHRRPVGSDRAEGSHRRRDAAPGWRHRPDRRGLDVRSLAARGCAPRPRDRDGLPDAARGRRRRRDPSWRGRRSASTACGGTSASRSGRSSPASSPTGPACPSPSVSAPSSPRPRAWSSSSGCARRGRSEREPSSPPFCGLTCDLVVTKLPA